MRKSFQLRCWGALILFCLYAFLCSSARAEVNFVQITDPHIFDDVSEAHDSRLDNKAALASCIERINRMAAQGGAGDGPQKMPPYDFVVVTGDLGIAQLLRGVDGKERENKIKSEDTQQHLRPQQFLSDPRLPEVAIGWPYGRASSTRASPDKALVNFCEGWSEVRPQTKHSL